MTDISDWLSSVLKTIENVSREGDLYRDWA